MYREVITLESIGEYRNYFKDNYCTNGVITHQGILVKFYEDMFDHAFYERKNRKDKNKTIFSIKRSQRISWIKEVLQDPTINIYQGWDSKRRCYDSKSKVSLVTSDGYVVVIRMIKQETAKFVTAYCIDENDVQKKIVSSPTHYVYAAATVNKVIEEVTVD